MVKYGSHLTYAVWTPDSENNGFLEGCGAEISILRPVSNFIYPYDYDLDLGWDKLYKYKIFINQMGIRNGQGPDESNTAPLFNIHYSLPVIFRAYAHEDYRALFTILIAVVAVESKTLFGMEGIPSPEMTPEMINFLERTTRHWDDDIKIFYSNSKISDACDANNWKVRLEKDRIYPVHKNSIIQAKAQLRERIFYKKYNRKISSINYEQLEIDWPQ